MDYRIRPIVEDRCIGTPGGLFLLPTRTPIPAVLRAFLASLPWRITNTARLGGLTFFNGQLLEASLEVELRVGHQWRDQLNVDP